MDRRKFIKKSALGAAFVGLSPLIPSAFKEDGLSMDNRLIEEKIFIFRGVSYADAFNALKKFDMSGNPNFHIQKVICNNQSFSHSEGLKSLLGKKANEAIQTQELSRYTIPQVLEDVFLHKEPYTKDCARRSIVHFHHTEIGHSSNKLYTENLELFFVELSKYYYKNDYKIIITADIGRNEKTNSCGGRDHSNETSLETFAIYLGGKATKLSAINNPISLNNVLKQKF